MRVSRGIFCFFPSFCWTLIIFYVGARLPYCTTSREVPPQSLVLLVSPVSAMIVKPRQYLCWYSHSRASVLQCRSWLMPVWIPRPQAAWFVLLPRWRVESQGVQDRRWCRMPIARWGFSERVSCLCPPVGAVLFAPCFSARCLLLTR